MSSRQHPDTVWISQVKESLDTWLADPGCTGPTSQITGGGAVQMAEQRFSSLHGDRPTLMVGNATAGMLAALRSVGVRSGSQVLIPAVDWPGTLAVVQALGAIPTVVPVDPETLTMLGSQAARLVTSDTAAVVVSHILGIPADVPAIRAVIGDVPIIEDCAQALGSTLDRVPVGCLGDMAVFSFGPGKTVDVGEAGMVVCRDWDMWTDLVSHAGHPVRQMMGGVEEPNMLNASSRPHPLAAVLLAEQLVVWDPLPRSRRFRRTARNLLATSNGITPLGLDTRRRSAAPCVPVRIGHTVDVDKRYSLHLESCGVYQIDRLAADGSVAQVDVWLMPTNVCFTRLERQQIGFTSDVTPEAALIGSGISMTGGDPQ